MISLLATFFTWSASNTSDMLGTSGLLVSDFLPLIAIVLGIILGVFIIKIITRIV